MRSALLLDTNRSAVPLHAHLVQDGYAVTVVGNDPRAPLARSASTHLGLDYSDHRAVADVLSTQDWTAVIPGCTDASYLAAAVAGTGRYRGLDSPEVARTVTDKLLLSDLMHRAGLPHPRRLSWDEAAASERVIVKPPHGHSGIGVRIVAGRDLDRDGGWARADGEHLLQEVVDGQLHSFSAFLAGGVIERHFLVREDCCVDPFAVDTSRVVPPGRRSDLRADLEAVVRRLATELGVVDGLIHLQVIVDGSDATVIEVARRLPGDLYASLVEASTGFPYARRYLTSFTGIGSGDAAPDGAFRHVVRHTVTMPEGVDLRGLRFLRPVLLRLLVPLAVMGDRPPPAGPTRAAIMLLQAADERQADSLYEDLLQRRLFAFDGLDGAPSRVGASA